VSFFLAAPLNRAITIPSDTEVATDRSELQEAIIYTTIGDLTISPPDLIGLRAWREGNGFEDYMPYVTSGLIEAPLFNEQPLEGDALYAGFASDLKGASLLLRIECDELEGAHIDPRNPPLIWEYWSTLERTWQPLRLLDQNGTGRLRELGAVDPTYGFNRSGNVYLNIPSDSGVQTVDGIQGTWFRVRYVERDGQGYTTSPRLHGFRAQTVGNTVAARQAQLISDEFIGTSDGNSDQIFTLAFGPIIRQSEPHEIEADLGDEITTWTEVEDFSLSTEIDRHFVIHYPTGEIHFGPSVRDRDGTFVQHGAVPRKDAALSMVAYRSGGGLIGNVGVGTINQLKTSLPYIAGVTNYKASGGGLDEETMQAARLRAVSVLKKPQTAITAEDYELLATQVPGVGAARCIEAVQDGKIIPGIVRLLVAPRLPAAQGEITQDLLIPSPTLIGDLAEHLDERKSLGTVVELEPAPVVWAEVDVHVYVKRGVDTDTMEETATSRLRRMFHPTAGTAAATGFGGAVTVSQVAGTLQQLPGVVYIERVRLRRRGDPEEVTRIQAPSDALLVIGRCYVLAEVIEE
jgi:predicted phage baseplate assembly protein